MKAVEKMPKGNRGGRRGNKSMASGKLRSSQEIEHEMNQINKQVGELQRNSIPGLHSEKQISANRTKINALLTKSRKLRQERSEALDREVKEYNEKHPQSSHHTFVNGFGEATHRYITTSTYERAMKRNDREIQARMKGYGKR